ncbi:MAG: hypothetical protein JXR90_11745 [Spirochaetes bacterium]|nr:hypothetical protein [Spirochaetota bacterium]
MEKNLNQTERICIPLLEEGTECWKLTTGIHIENDIFEVQESENYDPSDELWKFLPGVKVRCEKRELSDGEFLVAIEEIP